MNRRTFCLQTAFLAGMAPLASALPRTWADEMSAIDLLVYGGTPGGIATAVSAARQGLRVLLAEPTGRVGGLLSNGISHTDFRTYESLTGLYLEFCGRILAYYREKYGTAEDWDAVTMRGTHAEPHVNELVFDKMLAEAGVQVLKNAELSGLKMAKGKIKSAMLGEGGKAREIAAAYFADATYEGDLYAQAGVAFKVGREGQAERGETLAPLVANGQLQAYNFRLTMTQRPDLRVAVPKPANYRREDFAEVLPLLADGRIKQVFGIHTDSIYKNQPFYNPLPNGKFDINDMSNGLVRLSMPGENLAWPTGTKAQRQAIFQRHIDYNIGLLWFLQNDEAVPAAIRDKAREWGFCKDEFTDNGHLPTQIYVREARRMQGRYVFSQNDTNRAYRDARCIFHADSIAMGDYGPNCHGTSHEGPLYGGKHTGEYYLHTPPYQIPYGVLLPNEVGNLVVPVACSTTQIGFCALRYEPIWCALGQAAGLAVVQSLKTSKPLADIDIKSLQKTLHGQGAATIYVADVPPAHAAFAAVQWLGALGGLHQLSPTPPDNGDMFKGVYGRNITGQYFEAFPGHFFEPDKPADANLLARWKPLLPASAATTWQEVAQKPETYTRAQVAMKLHKANQV